MLEEFLYGPCVFNNGDIFAQIFLARRLLRLRGFRHSGIRPSVMSLRRRSTGQVKSKKESVQQSFQSSPSTVLLDVDVLLWILPRRLSSITRPIKVCLKCNTRLRQQTTTTVKSLKNTNRSGNNSCLEQLASNTTKQICREAMSFGNSTLLPYTNVTWVVCLSILQSCLLYERVVLKRLSVSLSMSSDTGARGTNCGMQISRQFFTIPRSNGL